VQIIQIPLGALPPESSRIATTPISHCAHVASGVIFGVLGPLQFGRVLAQKYGRLHHIMGRTFVIAGVFLSLSSLSLLWHFPNPTAVLLDLGRLVFGIGLGVALCLAMVAIRARDIPRHRNWMIRAYALGMGATLVSIVFLPIFLIAGTPPTGLVSDLIFIGSWAACVVFAEVMVRRLNSRRTIVS
jgi:uncharacterized membrane protein